MREKIPKIPKMPNRKLRKSLAKSVTIEEVEPLMSINRDDLVEILRLGVTTCKKFVLDSFKLPRWPARMLKSQEIQENSARVRLYEVELRSDAHAAAEIRQELRKILDKKYKWRHQLRVASKQCRYKLMSALKNKKSNASTPNE